MTIYEIAEKAGVSASTVSRVLNNYPYVQKETRAKVLKVLSENNFVPNDTARNLVTSTTNMIGILISDIRTTQHTDGVYYIEQEFSKNGYSCLIYNTGAELENQKKYIQLLSQRKVDAVVLMGSIYQNSTVQDAIMTYMPHTPVAICNGYLDGPNIYGVVADEYNGVYDSVKILVDRGRKNLVFATNPLTPSNENKVKGYKAGIHDFLPNTNAVVWEIGSETEEVKNNLKELFSTHKEVDGIVFAEDFLALIGIRVLSELGAKVPEDISIIGLNNSKFAEISIPSLTSIDNMLFDVSLTVARNLVEVLKGNHVNHKMMVCSRIIERDSTK